MGSSSKKDWAVLTESNIDSKILFTVSWSISRPGNPEGRDPTKTHCSWVASFFPRLYSSLRNYREGGRKRERGRGEREREREGGEREREGGGEREREGGGEREGEGERERGREGGERYRI